MRVEFSRIQDPLQGDPYIKVEALEEITADSSDWPPQAIKPRSAEALEEMWKEVVEKAEQPNGKKEER